MGVLNKYFQPGGSGSGIDGRKPERTRKMKIVNLTPHELNIHTNDGTVLSIESTGSARCDEKRETVDNIDNIPISAVVYGAVEGLPEPVEGVGYVVSLLVAQTTRRPDVFSPGELVQDDKGRTIGCRGLTAYTFKTVWQVQALTRESNAGWNYTQESLHSTQADAWAAVEKINSRSARADVYAPMYEALLKKKFASCICTDDHRDCAAEAKAELDSRFEEKGLLSIAYFGPSGPAKVQAVEVL